MRSPYIHALATPLAALLGLAGIAGCVFEPGALLPGGPDAGLSPDAPLPVDAARPVDARPPSDAVPIDAPVTMIDAPVPPEPDAAPGKRRKQITIRAQRVAGSQDLADFPVLFSVTDPDLADRAGVDGSDIHFTTQNGATALDFEIEKWVKDTGELVAWVKIPQLSAVMDTVFEIHYGDPEQTEPESPTDVWTNDFVAVWHLAEDPGPGTPGGIVDSTSGNDGTADMDMRSSDLVPGRIGNGIDFDGNGDEIRFQNPLSGATPHTISVWVNQRDTSSPDALVVVGNDATNQARWFYSTYTGGTVWFGFYANDHDTGIDIQNGDWTLLHWTFDGTQNRLYRNGVQQGGPATLTGVNTQGGDGRIGNVPPGNPGFGGGLDLDGQLDEVRIATVVRSAEWIQTEFNNQSDPGSFYDVGPEQP